MFCVSGSRLPISRSFSKLSLFFSIHFCAQSCHGFSAAFAAGLTWPLPNCQYPTTSALETRMTHTKACASRICLKMWIWKHQGYWFCTTTYFENDYAANLIGIGFHSQQWCWWWWWWWWWCKNMQEGTISTTLLLHTSVQQSAHIVTNWMTLNTSDVALTPQTLIYWWWQQFSGFRGGWRWDCVFVIQRHPKTPTRPSRTKCLQYCRATVFQHRSKNKLYGGTSQDLGWDIRGVPEKSKKRMLVFNDWPLSLLSWSLLLLCTAIEKMLTSQNPWTPKNSKTLESDIEFFGVWAASELFSKN